MIELFEKDIKTTDRKSSKGNQLKFERDGVWYKADNLGYEGLAECVVSDLLHKSSLQKNEFAEYLLSKGIDTQKADTFGKTAYDYAIENGYTELAELLKP